MGIAGLLPALEATMGTVRLEDLAGSKNGVCGHAWLHDIGAVFSYEVVCEGKTDSLVRVFVRRCCWLRELGIAVIVCFDGAPLSGKVFTAQKRAARRQAAWLQLESEKDPEQLDRLARVAFAVTEDLIRQDQNTKDSGLKMGERARGWADARPRIGTLCGPGAD